MSRIRSHRLISVLSSYGRIIVSDRSAEHYHMSLPDRPLPPSPRPLGRLVRPSRSPSLLPRRRHPRQSIRIPFPSKMQLLVERRKVLAAFPPFAIHESDRRCHMARLGFQQSLRKRSIKETYHRFSNRITYQSVQEDTRIVIPLE
jgi:hypothetical protein